MLRTLTRIFVFGCFLLMATDCFSNMSAKVYVLQEKIKGKNIKAYDNSMLVHRVISEKGGTFPKISKKNVRYGQDSFLVEVPSELRGIKSASYIKNRSEIFITKQVPLEMEHWIQFSMFLPKNFKYPDNWFLFFQVWQKYAGSPVLDFSLNKTGKVKIHVRTDNHYKGRAWVVYMDRYPLKKGIWHDFLINVNGSLRQKGKLSVWRRSGSKDSCFIQLVMKKNIVIGKSVYMNRQPIKKIDRVIIPRVGIYRGRSKISHQIWFDGLMYGRYSIMKYLDAKCFN